MALLFVVASSSYNSCRVRRAEGVESGPPGQARRKNHDARLQRQLRVERAPGDIDASDERLPDAKNQIRKRDRRNLYVTRWQQAQAGHGRRADGHNSGPQIARIRPASPITRGTPRAHQVITINGLKIFDTTLTEASVNSALPADAFAIPAELRGKAAAPAPVENVRWQWVLRRMGNGFYLDTDAYYTADGGSLKIQDIAPNISFVNGGSHNTLIVATNDGLIAVEAPGDDGQSKIVMGLAEQKYPGKPWKYLLLDHHHIDHIGGLRAFAAAGATIVVGKGDGAFYRKVNLDRTLQKVGGKLSDMVQMTVFITDVRYGDRLTQIRREVFGDNFPGSALITITALAVPDAKIEIQG